MGRAEKGKPKVTRKNIKDKTPGQVGGVKNKGAKEKTTSKVDRTQKEGSAKKKVERNSRRGKQPWLSHGAQSARKTNGQQERENGKGAKKRAHKSNTKRP